MTPASSSLTSYHGAMMNGTRWITAAGVMIALIAVVLLSRPDPRNRIEGQRNVVVILVDTLRADHVGLNGYQERPTTPAIDRLGHSGRWFESAWATAPWTVPSIMSLMTSMHPAVHGFNLEGHRYASVIPKLSPSIHTLAEVLRSNGYRTLAVTGGGGVGTVYGFDRGFDRFFEPETLTGEDVENGVNLAIEWLRSGSDQPYFLFFHTYEVHLPNTHSGFSGGELASDQASAAYDSDLAFADRHLGRLFRELNLADTLIIITADHGENLHDRILGERPVEHGHHLHDELLHIPLIFIAPGLIPDSGTIPGQVQLTDVMPTILSLVGIETGRLSFQGKDLRGILQGWSPAPLARPVFAEAPLQGPDWHAIRTPNAKLMVTPHVGGTNWWNHLNQPVEALYFLGSDPHESNNVLEVEPEFAGGLHQILDRQLSACAKLRRDLGPVTLVPVGNDQSNLEALGYIDRTPPEQQAASEGH